MIIKHTPCLLLTVKVFLPHFIFRPNTHLVLAVNFLLSPLHWSFCNYGSIFCCKYPAGCVFRWKSLEDNAPEVTSLHARDLTYRQTAFLRKTWPHFRHHRIPVWSSNTINETIITIIIIRIFKKTLGLFIRKVFILKPWISFSKVKRHFLDVFFYWEE